jgi:hypothetical protein
MNYVIDTIVYNANKNGSHVFRDDKTIGYIFINTGNCAVQLNNFTLQPNSTFKTFESGYEDKTKWQMIFDDFSSCATINSSLTCLIYSKA